MRLKKNKTKQENRELKVLEFMEEQAKKSKILAFKVLEVAIVAIMACLVVRYIPETFIFVIISLLVLTGALAWQYDKQLKSYLRVKNIVADGKKKGLFT